MGEQLAALFARSFGCELVGLRYFNVYGPRQNPEGPYAAVVPRFLTAAPRPGDVRHSLADLTAARHWLRYAPRVGLAEGLRLLWEDAVPPSPAGGVARNPTARFP